MMQSVIQLIIQNKKSMVTNMKMRLIIIVKCGRRRRICTPNEVRRVILWQSWVGIEGRFRRAPVRVRVSLRKLEG